MKHRLCFIRSKVLGSCFVQEEALEAAKSFHQDGAWDLKPSPQSSHDGFCDSCRPRSGSSDHHGNSGPPSEGLSATQSLGLTHAEATSDEYGFCQGEKGTAAEQVR